MHVQDSTHGDLGQFCIDDIIFAISNSGQTDEVKTALEALAAKFGPDFSVKDLPIIAVTGTRELSEEKKTNNEWLLADHADHIIHTGSPAELCPIGKMPTLSVLCMRAEAGRLAIAVAKKMGLTLESLLEKQAA